MVKKLTTFFALGAPLVIAFPVAADTLFGVYAGAGTWQQGFTGGVAGGGEVVDLDDDLDFQDEANNVFYFAVEHGVPGLPNVRVNYSDVAGSGANLLSRSIVFNGRLFAVSEDVASGVQLTQADAVFYYELLDDRFSLDVGLAGRWVDGEIDVAADSGFARAEFQGTLPMLYARSRVDLPLGTWLGAEVMGLAYQGHDLIDANAQLGWQSAYGVGAELGWRTLRLELGDVDDIDRADIDISGPYAALNFRF